ncbi:transposable element Tcb1 transposase [Trichonephila clavipes]|nr:transposable element Tcb1 transposase [Trichonephila clavipes]
MSRRKQQSAFDPVSEFDRGRIVTYRDCGLSFREIVSRVGRNQTTVMRIFTHLSATPRWSDSSLETPWREDAEQLRYAPPHWSCTEYYGMGRCIGYHSRTPIVRIAGTLNSQRYISEVLEPLVLPYHHGLGTAIFQKDNVRPHVHALSKGSSSITRLNCFPGRLTLRIFRQ